MSGLSKKNLKKFRKIKTKLNAENLKLSNEPTCYVVIANGGLGNGISVKQITELLEGYGKLNEVKSLHAKAYALAYFVNEKDAAQCVDSLQGHVLQKCAESSTSMLFLYFLISWPDHIDLFDSESAKHMPEGLYKIEDFITPQEEKQLLEEIDKDISTISQSHIQESLKKRIVLHYGYKFRYGSNDVDSSKPLCKDGLPSFSTYVVDRMMNTGHMVNRPDQITVNKYNPGDGIPPHIDNPVAFAAEIASISLGSPVVMEMKHEDGRKFSVVLQPRTLIIFTGESRYKWKHGIPARKTDIVKKIGEEDSIIKRGTRISLTFRKTLSTDIKEGSEKSIEDSSCSLPSNNDEAVALEGRLVHKVYSNIASHFSSTRDKPWPRVVNFLKTLQPGSTVLDVGCGSGRYLNSNRELFMLGCDRCPTLMEICSAKNSPVFICDGLNLPVRSASFDSCICIAVIHHYSTHERRLAAVKEILRVIRRGGFALIYVWAVEQSLNGVRSNYLKPTEEKPNVEDEVSSTPRECLPEKTEGKTQLIIHKNKTEFAQQDVLVPWTKKNADVKNRDVYFRFYHVFEAGELESLCRTLPYCNVIDSYYDNGNWSVTLQKI